MNCMGLAFAGMLMASCTDSPTAVADYQVVPMPLEITAASQGFVPAEERGNHLLYGRE